MRSATFAVDARSTEPSFDVLLEPERDAIRVVPVGDLDIATVPTLHDQIAEVVAAGFARVILDLRRLEFIDSSGLHLVVRSHERAQREGWELSLIQGPPPVRRLLELTAALGQLNFVRPGEAR